jgi:hypothetical protein
MYVESVLAFTPAAIIRLAYVCRASCGVIGFSPAAFHVRRARAMIVEGSNGFPSEAANMSPSARPLRSLCSAAAWTDAGKLPALHIGRRSTRCTAVAGEAHPGSEAGRGHRARTRPCEEMMGRERPGG